MSKAIAYILSNETDVTDLLNGNADGVNTLFAEQEDNLPFIVIDEEDVEPTDDFKDSSDLDRVSFTVFAFARQEYTGASNKGARDIINQVRSTLEAASDGIYNTETISNIRKEGGVIADYVNWGGTQLVMAYQSFTMWREVAAGTTLSVPAILLTQVAYDALASYNPSTYYLIDNT